MQARFDRLDPRPFAVTLTAGVLLIHALPTLPPLWFSALCALPALLPWRLRVAWSGFALGVLLSVWHGQQWLDLRWPEARQNEEHVVKGRIASLPSQDGDATHFLFAPDQSPSDGDPLPPLIRVAWYRNEAPLRGGDCWQLDLRLHAPRGSANAAGFDFEGWLYRQGIEAMATARSGQPCADRSGYFVLRAREAIRQHYALWLPDHPARGFVAALTVGDESSLHAADWQVFQTTGTIHLVVVAGLHVGIVAGSLYFILRWLWALVPALCLWLPAQRAAAIGAALFAVVYATLAGFETPAMRATLMVLLALFAALLDRRASPGRILALAWIGALLLQPGAVLSPGVWLSFGAVAAIAYACGGRLGPIPAWRRLLVVQFMLSAALAPLTLFFFQGLSWVAPLVNLLILPLLAVLMPLLVAALLLALLWPGIGVPLLRFAADLVWKLHEGLAWLATHAPHPWWLAAPPAAALLLAAFGGLLLFAPRGLPTRGLGVVLLLPLLLPPSSGVMQGFRMTVLDVGQGLSVAVRTAHHSLVFDTGPAYAEGYDAGRSVVVPDLVAEGVRRLDMMIVSHPDLDHRGGAPAVRELLAPRDEIGALAPTRPCRDGQSWNWDGVDFRMLHPAEGVEWSRNNGGCVLRVSTGRYVVLLPADTEAPVEQRLLRDHREDLRADVLVAPHHGSRTSSTPDFVAAVHPQIVIYPTGFANSYRLPRTEVVERYRALGAQDYMTGTEGAIVVDIDPDHGIGPVTEWRNAAPRFWRAPVLPVTENK